MNADIPIAVVLDGDGGPDSGPKPAMQPVSMVTLNRRLWQKRMRNTNLVLLAGLTFVIVSGVLAGRKPGMYTAANFGALLVFVLGVAAAGIRPAKATSMRVSEFKLRAAWLYFWSVFVFDLLFGSAILNHALCIGHCTEPWPI